MKPARLRHVAQINPAVPGWDLIDDEEELTFVPLEAVWPGRVRFTEHKPKAAVATGYTRFIEGDVVVPKITPTFEGDRSTRIEGMPTRVGAGTTELHVIRCGPMVDSRYVSYLMSSRQFLHGGAAEMIGVAGQKRVPDDWLRDTCVWVGNLGQQRSIADHLDTETARIDALVAKKRRMIELLDEREQCMIDRAFGPDDYVPLVRLGYVGVVQTGLTVNAGRAEEHSDLTVPYLRVANVQHGRLDLSEVKVVRVPAALAARSRLRTGDVLMTEGGDIDKLGRGTVWNDEVPGATHQNHVFAVRADRSRLSPEFLAHVTRSAHARAYFESTGVQSTNLASTSSTKVADFRLPLPSRDEQDRITANFDKWSATNVRIVSAIRQQLELLVEHRQALITAAVTGALAISGVAT